MTKPNISGFDFFYNLQELVLEPEEKVHESSPPAIVSLAEYIDKAFPAKLPDSVCENTETRASCHSRPSDGSIERTSLSEHKRSEQILSRFMRTLQKSIRTNEDNLSCFEKDARYICAFQPNGIGLYSLLCYCVMNGRGEAIAKLFDQIFRDGFENELSAVLSGHFIDDIFAGRHQWF